MHVVVCVKQVPDTTNVRINPKTNTLMREGVESIVNPFDEYALEEALRLKDRLGAKVSVVSMGPPQAAAVLREALARGADEAFLVSSRAFGGADTLATSYTLSQAIRKACGGKTPDLVLFGKQAIDGDTAQVGAELAEYLGVPHAANVLSVDAVEDGVVFVTVNLDDKIVKESIKLPCLLCVDGDINSPRLPSYKVKKTVGDELVRFLSFADFADQNEKHYGLAGSATQVERIFPPEKNTEKRSITGSAAEQAEGIFDLLVDRKLI